MKAVQRTRGSSGAYLLEYAFALPLLLTLTLGALDVARVLQVKSAVTKAAETAVRCVYTLDGGTSDGARCIDTSAAAPSALYNWYRITTPPQFEVNRYDYDGEALWFGRRRETYTNFRARILSDYSYSVSQDQLQATLVSYPLRGEREVYLKTAGMPYVTGDPLSPVFRFNDERSASLPQQRRITPGVVLTASPGAVASQSFTFRLNQVFGGAIDSEAPRLEANRIDRTGPYAVARDRLSGSGQTAYQYGLSQMTNQTRVIIHVRGNGTGAGEVTLSLTWQGGGVDLGGRQFSGTGSANFVPRGVDLDRVDAALLGPGGYVEYPTYAGLVIPRNKDITATLSLASAPGSSATWESVDVRIWTPQYERFSRSDWVCANGGGLITRGQHAHNQATGGAASCVLGAEQVPVASVSVNTSSPVYGPPQNLGCGFGVLAAQAAIVQQHGSIEAASYDYAVAGGCDALVVQSAPGSCGEFGQSVAGGQSNYGVPEPAGPDGRVRGSALAAAICPAQPTQEMQNLGVPVPANVSWGERVVVIPDPSSPGQPFTLTHLPESCEDRVSFAQPITYVPEAKRIIPVPEYTDAPLFTTDDPRVLRTQHPALYDCTEFPIASRQFNETVRPELPITSLFRGVYEDLGNACWEERLRMEAEALGLPVGVFFEGTRSKRAPAVYGEMPSTQCGAEVRVTYDSRGEEELVTQQPLRAGERPVECESPSMCRTELVGFEGGQYSGPVENFEAAASMGLQEIESVFPAAVRCSGMGQQAEPNCINVTVVPQDVALGRAYSARAEAEVPLRLLFGRSLRVVSDSTELSEAEFAR